MNLDAYSNIKYEKRISCPICNSPFGAPLIEYPLFPLTEIYVEDKISDKLGLVDQAFHYCDNCGFGSLKNIIDPKVLYNDTYKTRTTGSSAVGAIDVFLNFINNNLDDNPIDSIVEIGCNDTYTLSKLKGKAKKLFGIDPILKGREQEFQDENITTFGDFFENVNLNEIGNKLDVVISSHALEHISDPKSLIEKTLDKADPNTQFFFQFPGLELLIDNARFDQVHHQHYNYFTVDSVVHMLSELGAELINYEFNPNHWGALMIYFKRKVNNNTNKYENVDISRQYINKERILNQYNLFLDSMDLANRRILSYSNKKIYGFGAALMLPLLAYYINDFNKLDSILDDDKSKNDLYYLNLPIQIKNPKSVEDLADNVIFVTGLNSRSVLRSITTRLIDLGVRDIIIPTNLF